MLQHEESLKHNAKWKKSDTKATHCTIPLIWDGQEAKQQRQKVDGWLLRAGGFGRQWEVSADGYGISLSGDENVLKLIVALVVQLCEYTQLYTLNV